MNRRPLMFWSCLALIAGIGFVIGCEPDGPATAEPKEPKATDPAEPTAGDDNPAATADDPSADGPLDTQFTETIPPTLVEFEMVLVPASDGSDEKPFYMGKTEVTWDEFIYWALCEDLKEKKAIIEREQKLRPSAPHDTKAIYRGWGRDGQPAVGVSWLSAQRYCEWLSEQTGKNYRLPTAQEWERAFVAGGGQLDQVPPQDELVKVAWCAANSLDEETFDNRAMPVATLAANQLGIHDMLGNVAEWVTGDPDSHVVRGGSFITPADALNGAHEEAEDQNVWNKNYPNTPKSQWWYVDADYVGFRVVCDPQ